MSDDLYAAVIGGLLLVPIFGTVAGWLHEGLLLRSTRVTAGTCPACKHPEHWPWCQECGCDLFTEPDDHDRAGQPDRRTGAGERERDENMALTVRELIDDLQKLNPDHLVVLSKDAAGNDYSPLDSYSTGRYEAHSTWSGDVYDNQDPEAPDGLPEVVVLWPTN